MTDWRDFLKRHQPSPTAPVPFWAVLLVEMLGEIMTQADQIAGDVANLGTSLTTITNDLQVLINQLKSALPPINPDVLAQLDSIAQSYAGVATQIDSVVNPPAPAPAPEPTPDPTSGS